MFQEQPIAFVFHNFLVNAKAVLLAKKRAALFAISLLLF